MFMCTIMIICACVCVCVCVCALVCVPYSGLPYVTFTTKWVPKSKWGQNFCPQFVFAKMGLKTSRKRSWFSYLKRPHYGNFINSSVLHPIRLIWAFSKHTTCHVNTSFWSILGRSIVIGRKSSCILGRSIVIGRKSSC